MPVKHVLWLPTFQVAPLDSREARMQSPIVLKSPCCIFVHSSCVDLTDKQRCSKAFDGRVRFSGTPFRLTNVLCIFIRQEITLCSFLVFIPFWLFPFFFFSLKWIFLKIVSVLDLEEDPFTTDDDDTDPSVQSTRSDPGISSILDETPMTTKMITRMTKST